jgi:hypothetical protein
MWGHWLNTYFAGMTHQKIDRDGPLEAACCVKRLDMSLRVIRFDVGGRMR